MTGAGLVERAGVGTETRSARRPSRTRTGVAVAIGAAAGCAVAVARGVDADGGPPWLVLAAVLVVLVPTSRDLSRRIVVAGAVLLGWLPVTWWLSWPVDRVSVLLVALACVSVGWTTHIALQRGLREALPRFRVLDVLPLLVGAASLAATRPWWAADGATSALAMLLTGWDNVGHYSMWQLTAAHGQVVDTLAPPAPGVNWVYAFYPSSFHAVAATLSEIAWPGAAQAPEPSIIAFGRSVAVMFAVVSLMVAASVVSMARARGAATEYRAWVVGGAVAALLVVGPGARALELAFSNYFAACGLVFVGIVLAAQIPRAASWPHLIALVGCAVGVAGNWIVLLVLLVPAVVASLLGGGRSYWGTTRQRVLVALVVGAGFAGVLRPISVLSSGGVGGNQLLVPGGAFQVPVAPLAALVLVASALALVHLVRPRSGVLHRRTRIRLLVIASTVPIGVVVSALVAWVQVSEIGTVAYYLWKFLAAFLFAVTAVVVVLWFALPARPVPAASQRGVTAAAVCLGVAASSIFGYWGPERPAAGWAFPGSPTSTRATYVANAEALTPAAERMLAAQRASAGVPALDDVAYLDLPAGGITVNPILAQQWFLALRSQWTLSNNGETIELDQGQGDAPGTAAVASAWLSSRPQGVLFMPQDALQQVGPLLAPEELARVRPVAP